MSLLQNQRQVSNCNLMKDVLQMCKVDIFENITNLLCLNDNPKSFIDLSVKVRILWGKHFYTSLWKFCQKKNYVHAISKLLNMYPTKPYIHLCSWSRQRNSRHTSIRNFRLWAYFCLPSRTGPILCSFWATRLSMC